MQNDYGLLASQIIDACESARAKQSRFLSRYGITVGELRAMRENNPKQLERWEQAYRAFEA